jgi:hypothetical protein
MSKNIKNILREACVFLVAAILVLTALVMVPTTVADSSDLLPEETEWDYWTYDGFIVPGVGWTDQNKDEEFPYFGWWRLNDDNSGGSPYEVWLDFNLTIPNYVFYSPAFSTEGYSDCVLEFLSYIKYYPSVSGVGYSLNAGWSTDTSTWYPVWSIEPDDNYNYDVSVPIPSGQDPLYIGFWVEGFNMWMNFWYIDNVKVTGEECSVESVIAAITAIWDYIDLLDCGAEPPDFSTPCKKNTLHNKLILDDDSVIGLLNQAPPNYGDAIGKLVNDIRPKMDGDDTPPDWIINSDAQEDLCEMIDNLIPCLEFLDAGG